jgi:hypothetical protein
VVRVIKKDSAFRAVLSGAKGLINLVMASSVSVTMANGKMFTFTKDGMEIGVNPTDWMALASLVKAEIKAVRDTLDGLVTVFNAHTHPYLPGPGPATAPSLTTLTPGSPPAAVNDVKSVFVKST